MDPLPAPAFFAATEPAVRGMDFSVGRGEIFGFLGPSGAGKSSLLRVIYLTLRPSSGRVNLFGRELDELRRRDMPLLRRRMGVVFQDFRLLNHLTALDNVALPLRIAGVREAEVREHVTELLKWVGLADQVNAYPATLSGGQQQRVAIARALVNEPAILIADEPTGALDSKTGADIIGLFQSLHTDFGQTVILVTHDPFIGHHAGRILRLGDGRIVSDEVNPSPIKAGTPRPEGED